jgi:D-alanine--poly(phosphoribitol) ligase subunit 1
MNLLERIDHRAKAAPNSTAHISSNRKLTFGQLGTRSNTLATHILEQYGNDRAPVAVIGHREPEMIVAFLGAVKSGRPYVPIDTALPDERIRHILAISRPALVLTPQETAKLSHTGRAAPSPCPLQPDSPFYIMFTSGSTGAPKGIIITLSCLEHFIEWMLQEQKFIEQGEIFLNQVPFSFDVSGIDLYCGLVTGGTVVSITRDLLANPKSLYRALADSDITTWVSTPSFAEMCLVEPTFNQALLKRVRRFLFCGEILLPATVRLLLDRFPNAEIWNLYGPTETTIATTSIRIDRDVLQKYSTLPIGRPMPGTEVLVIDENRNQLPSGSRGEIIVRGPNVSPGYLGRPDLTASRFFNENGQRAYRTGDWGRFRDGLLFFEGRIDNQVKLSGYRIELGDLEANLRALPIVRDAAVLPVVKNGKVKWLTAFVIPNANLRTRGPSLTTTLREGLRERLPAYMLPHKFVIVDAFPLTANGKVDRQKLAESL